jgi:hypothetical protein
MVVNEWNQLGLETVNMPPLLEMLDFQHAITLARLGVAVSERPLIS